MFELVSTKSLFSIDSLCLIRSPVARDVLANNITSKNTLFPITSRTHGAMEPIDTRLDTVKVNETEWGKEVLRGIECAKRTKIYAVNRGWTTRTYQ